MQGLTGIGGVIGFHIARVLLNGLVFHANTLERLVSHKDLAILAADSLNQILIILIRIYFEFIAIFTQANEDRVIGIFKGKGGLFAPVRQHTVRHHEKGFFLSANVLHMLNAGKC